MKTKIIDRIILIVMVVAVTLFIKPESVIYAALGAVIFAGFSYGFEDSAFHQLILAVAGIVSLVAEDISGILILCVYEAFTGIWNRKYSHAIIISVTLILHGIRILMGKVIEMAPLELIILLVSSALAVYLSYMTHTCDELRKKNYRMRDDNEEFRMLAAQKNELMRRQQDDGITMATLAERNRIAREIHDNVGHLLSRSILQMGALQAVYKEEPLASSLREVSATLNESMTSVRNSVHDLHNESIDLRKAVEDIIERQDRVKIKFDYDMRPEVDREVKYAIISIVTESLENVRKHSDADLVKIAIIEHPAFYRILVSDNGHPGKVHESGIGLHNMKSRIDELGGIINFSANDGFTVHATIPKKGNT